jgi:hypothetical protein
MATDTTISVSLKTNSVTNHEGKTIVRIPLICTEKWHCTLSEFWISECRETRPKGALIQIGGEIVDMVLLCHGIGRIREDPCPYPERKSPFQLEGSEMEIVLLDGTPERKPIPGVKFCAKFTITIEKKKECNITFS